MHFAASLIVFAATAFALPETSQEPKQEEPQATEKAEEPKKICRRIQSTTGSRRKERVCMTPEEWREFNRGE